MSEQKKGLWGYEALFDVEELTELEKRVWQATRSEIRVGRMGYRTKTIKSGDVLEVEVYPIWGRIQERQAREARSKVSPERIRKHNLAAAKRKLVRLVNTNFGPQDIHLSLTYNGTPPSFEQVQKDVHNFLRRVKRLRKKRGLSELKAIYSVEGGEDGEGPRGHAHIIMNGGISREELEELWAKGYANADRLQPNEQGLAAVARYIVKSHREKNRRMWSCTKNLKKPKESISDTKLSNRRVKTLALDLPAVGKEILEKLFAGYRYVELNVRWSDYVDGCFIRAQMIREGGEKEARHGKAKAVPGTGRGVPLVPTGGRAGDGLQRLPGQPVGAGDVPESQG